MIKKIVSFYSFLLFFFLFAEEKSAIFWYQEFPTIGLSLSQKDSYWDAFYPFLPHCFSLNVMAQTQGKGVTIGIIDTGIVAGTVLEIDPLFNYNLAPEGLKKTFEEFVAFVGSHLDRNRFQEKKINYLSLEKRVARLLCDYCFEKNFSPVQNYLKKYAADHLFDMKRENFSSHGDVVLKKIKQVMDQFHGTLLKKNSGDSPIKAIAEFLPFVECTDTKSSMLHGSYVAEIITGARNGFCGIAPHAKIVMIKAFGEHQESYQSVLVAALIKALQSHVQIVTMSLKATDFMNESSDLAHCLKFLIEVIPYSFASSGNDAEKNAQKRQPLIVESYPGKLEGITFDVGAFGYDSKGKNCFIPSFSQYELDEKTGVCRGPRFVMPGCGIINKESSIDGTSMGVPFLAGFMALVLGEFKDDEEFTREHLLKVCYRSGIMLQSTQEWHEKSRFGTLDMRTALFTLHVLRAFFRHCPESKIIFREKFDQLVELVQIFLCGMANEYTCSKNSVEKVDLKNDFMAFYNKIKKDGKKVERFHVIFTSFESAVSFSKEALLAASGLIPYKEQPFFTSSIFKTMQNVLKKSGSLFSEENVSTQKRFVSVAEHLHENKKEISRYLGKVETEKLAEDIVPYYTYWQKQCTFLKKGRK